MAEEAMPAARQAHPRQEGVLAVPETHLPAQAPLLHPQQNRLRATTAAAEAVALMKIKTTQAEAAQGAEENETVISDISAANRICIRTDRG